MRILLNSLFLLLLFGCGGGDGDNDNNLVNNDSVLIRSIQISADNASSGDTPPSIPLGTALKYKAIGSYSDGTTRNITTEVAWKTSDTTVVTIDRSGAISTLKEGSVVINANLAGVQSNSFSLTVTPAKVTQVQISTPSTNIAQGTTQNLLAMATMTDQSTQDVSALVVWRTSDAEVLSIDNKGVASAISRGSVVVNAEIDGVISNNLQFVVTEGVVVSLQISPANSSVAAGLSSQFTAIAAFSDGRTQDVTTGTTWNSSDSTVVAIDALGLATGVKEGVATVSATFNNIASNNATLAVTSAVVMGVQVTPAVSTLFVTTTRQFTAIATLSDNSTQNVSSQAIWSTSDAQIASINSVGLVTAVAEGVATISATVKGVVSNSAKITISDNRSTTVTQLQITPSVAAIAKGTTRQFTAIAKLADNTTQDVTNSVIWNSSAADVSSINASGLAKGLAVGNAVITATFNGVTSNSVQLSITAAQVSQMQITPSVLTLASGTHKQLVATATFTDGTTQDVTTQAAWISSDLAVATVDIKGDVTAVAMGTTSISASLNGVSVSTALTVSAATVSRLQVSTTLGSIAAGTGIQFSAIATYSDSTTQDVSSSVAWNSNNTTVVTINGSGYAVGEAQGQAIITANFQGVTSNEATLDITAAVVSEIQVSISSSSLSAGTSAQLMAVATFSDSSSQNVTSQVAWSSGDVNLATISSVGILTAVQAGKVNVTASLNGVVSNTLPISITSAVVTQLVVTASNTSFAAGTSTQLTGTAYFSDGSTQDVSSQMSWSSTNPSVVTVDANGVASGITSGNTSVSGRFNGVNSNVLSVSVSAAMLSAIQISPAIATIAKGTNSQFTALATYSDNSSQDITSQVAWDSSATGIVTINAAGLAKGVGVGAATIKANLNGVQSNSATLTVSNAVVTQLQLSPTSASIAAGTSRQFLATATYSDGSTQNLSNLVAWRSSDTTVATINGNGLAQGVSPGNATIQASIGGVTANVPLSVTAATVSKVQISGSLGSIAVGTTSQFTAIATFTDSSTQDVTSAVSWTSDDTVVATIQANGLAKGVAEGDANISATFNGVSSNASLLTVTAATATQLQISASTNSLSAGTTTQLSAIATFTDGSTQNVSTQVAWSSSNTGVATVSATGLVTGVIPGNTVISGSFSGLAGNNLAIGVTSAVVTQLVVTASNTSFAAGTSTQLTGTAYFSDGSTQDVSSQMSWSSTNPSVVTVDATGLAAGALPGSASIGGTFGGVASNVIVVNITAATLTSIQISPAIATIAKGTNSQFTAIATYSDDSSQDVTTQVSWDSDDTDVVTITATGLAKGVLSGQVSVSAIWGGVVSNTATITVTAAVVTQIQVTPSTASVAAGTNRQFTATATYSDGSTQNLTNLVSWNSSNTATATINTNGLARGVAAGAANIQATKDGVVSNVVSFNITAATLTSLQISPASASIAAGTKSQFTAIGTYSDGSNQTLTTSVHWDSSAPSIASIVSNTGLSTGVATGTATIKASLSGVTSNLATLTVTAATVTQIQVTPTSNTLAAGTTKQLTAIATLTDGRTQDISSLVAWLSVDPQVVTVSSSGLLTAVMPGSTTVTARFSGVVSNTANITTTAATVTQLQVTPAIVNLALGTSQQLKAIATYTDSSTQVVTSLVSWESNAIATASVDPQGLAMAAAVGQAVIKAKLNGVDSNSVTLTVTAAVVNSLTISPVSASLAAGTTKQFMATATFSDTSVQDLTEQVTWSSSDTSVATILPSGLATAETPGNTTITAAINGVVANVPMTVTAATVSFINISTNAGVTILPLGSTTNMSASAIYSDDSIQDITHLVSWAINTDAVTVDALGVVEAVNLGTADVTATLGGVTSDPITFTVTNAVVSSLTITPATYSLALGNSLQYVAIATYSDTTSLDVSNQVAWNSSNRNAATISINGFATTVALGNTTITASFNGVASNSATLSVTAAVLDSIVLSSNYNGSFITILGSPIQIIATGEYSDGTRQVLRTNVVWEFSRAGLITITGLGDLKFENTSVLSAVDISATHSGIRSVNYMSIDCLASIPLLGTRICNISSTDF